MRIHRPTPLGGEDIVFQIPDVLRKEFAADLRVVIRHPWIVGIPVPERLIPDLLRDIRTFDVVMAPHLRARAATPLAAYRRDLTFKIPEKLVHEFADDLRVVIRHPWIVGIPVPERLIPDVLKGLDEFEMVMTPEEFGY